MKRAALLAGACAASAFLSALAAGALAALAVGTATSIVFGRPDGRPSFWRFS
jgi:hypothetical protein